MPLVLVTGMSGTGKSTALAELARRAHRVVDTDYGRFSENDFGKTDAERDLIVQDLATFEQLLRTTSTTEIDTRAPLDEVVDALERIAKPLTGR